MTSLEIMEGEPEGQSLRLWRVVLSLAQVPDPPALVVRTLPAPGLAENLVVEFDEAYTAFVDGIRVLPNEGRLLALQTLDSKLSAMVGAKDAALWTEKARREDPVWTEVRSLATQVLVEFEWPTGQS